MKPNLDTRDYINVGIFSAVYFVLLFATGMLGFAAPWMMFVGWALGILLNGYVIVLLLARVRKFGAMTLLGILVGLSMMTTGHPYHTLLIMAGFGFIADMIASDFGRATELQPKRVMVAYGIFCLWFIGPLLPILYNSAAYYQQIAAQIGPEYAEGMKAIFQPWIIGIWALVLVVLGLIGGYLGTRAHRKHFVRAGLTR